MTVVPAKGDRVLAWDPVDFVEEWEACANDTLEMISKATSKTMHAMPKAY
jgi:hypothetical protein